MEKFETKYEKNEMTVSGILAILKEEGFKDVCFKNEGDPEPGQRFSIDLVQTNGDQDLLTEGVLEVARLKLLNVSMITMDNKNI